MLNNSKEKESCCSEKQVSVIGNKVAPLIHVGFEYRVDRDDLEYGQLLFESYDYQVAITNESDMWRRRPDGTYDSACQLGGRLVQCNKSQKSTFFVCSDTL